jgi:hypothetical protein
VSRPLLTSVSVRSQQTCKLLPYRCKAQGSQECPHLCVPDQLVVRPHQNIEALHLMQDHHNETFEGPLRREG